MIGDVCMQGFIKSIYTIINVVGQRSVSHPLYSNVMFGMGICV